MTDEEAALAATLYDADRMRRCIQAMLDGAKAVYVGDGDYNVVELHDAARCIERACRAKLGERAAEVLCRDSEPEQDGTESAEAGLWLRLVD